MCSACVCGHQTVTPVPWRLEPNTNYYSRTHESKNITISGKRCNDQSCRLRNETCSNYLWFSLKVNKPSENVNGYLELLLMDSGPNLNILGRSIGILHIGKDWGEKCSVMKEKSRKKHMLAFSFTYFITPPLGGKAHTHPHVHVHTKVKYLHKWQVANIWPLSFLKDSNCVLALSDGQGLSGRNECSGKGRLARYE